MTEKEQKSVFASNMNVGVYTIYDCVLKQYDVPFCIQVTKLGDYLSLLVNDVQSKYYNHESDYIVNKIGNFNTDNGEIKQHFIKRICVLDKYVDAKKRKLQTIIATLNYLPSGYFKMPEEMKKDIQVQINEAVQKYVSDYVVPDLDVNNTSNDVIKSLKDKIKSLEDELHSYRDLTPISSTGYGLLDN